MSKSDKPTKTRPTSATAITNTDAKQADWCKTPVSAPSIILLPRQTRSKKQTVHYELTLSAPPVFSVDSDQTDSDSDSVSEPNTDCDNEMAEAKTFRPSDFCGSADVNAKIWMSDFDKYVDFCDYDAPKSLKMLKLLLKGAAAQWLESLPGNQKDTLPNLKTAFKDRYEASVLVKYQSASDLFNRRQKDTESVEEYITTMSEIAGSLGADAKTLTWALKNGMREYITAFLIQTNS